MQSGSRAGESDGAANIGKLQSTEIHAVRESRAQE